MMNKVLFCVLLLSGCTYWFETNKTPLTPQGQMNVCIRDEVRTFKADGRLQTWGVEAASEKIADICTSRYNLSGMYSQAVANAKDMIYNSSEGTTLRRW